MKTLYSGEFYGLTNHTVRLDGLTITDTEYTHDYVDWHYHENAYFTFILNGRVTEGNKKETYHCRAGTLLFHNWQDPHYNIKPAGFTRGFHVELSPAWFAQQDINPDQLKGSLSLPHPQLSMLMYDVFKESKLDPASSLPVNMLLAELFSCMTATEDKAGLKKPLWVAQIRNLLHDSPDHNWTLESLSNQLSLHPVHLSRNFSRYFHCNIGEYMRLIKLERAMGLLSNKAILLTTIASQCGFADQSHFIRTFKAYSGMTPLAYRRLF